MSNSQYPPSGPPQPYMPFSPQPTPPKKRSRIKIAAIGFVGFIVVCCAFGAVLNATGYVSSTNRTATALANPIAANTGGVGKDTTSVAGVVVPTVPRATDLPVSTALPSATSAPTNTPLPTETPGPTNTPEPTNTPAPTNTPRPTNTPEPTSTPVPPAPPVEEIRSNYQNMTDAQWDIYKKILRDVPVEGWEGWISDVSKTFGTYYAHVDIDPPGSLSVSEILFEVDENLAIKLRKDGKIRMVGRIDSVGSTLGTLSISLDDVTVEQLD